MPIYSEPANYNPTLFDSKLCNCYRFFNDAFINLEIYLDAFIKTRRMDGDMMSTLSDEIRRAFMAAFIILGDDDRAVSAYRSVFLQYAFVGGMLDDNVHAARFFDHRWAADRNSLPQEDLVFYQKISRAAANPKEVTVFNDDEIPIIGNLAMFIAVNRGYAVCQSRTYINLTANDFLLRFIVGVCYDESPLFHHMGAFSWLNLPEEYIHKRPMLFFGALSEASGDLDVGKRYVLRCALNNFKDYALDHESAAYFRLGYRCYNQLYEDTTRLLDDKAREMELYHLYGGSTEELPASWHFKRLSRDFASENGLAALIAATFRKNELSRYELDRLQQSKSGFLDSLLDQVYYFNPMKGFVGSRKIKFIFNNYPRVIYADFVQFSENAVNYFWLPEMPAKVLNAHDDTEFYLVTHIKKLNSGMSPLKFDMDGDNLSVFEEPFRGMYLYGYAARLLESGLDAGFFTDNPAIKLFAKYLRNLPKDMAQKTTLHLLKHSGFIERGLIDIIMDQMIFIQPDTETLKRVITQGSGRHAAALLDVLGLTPEELFKRLGEREFGKLVTVLIDWTSGGIYFNRAVAEILENQLKDGKLNGGDEALYLSTSYALYNFKSAGTFGALEYAAGVLFGGSGGKTMPPGMETRFLSLFLNAKMERLEFDEQFFDAFGRLWTLGDEPGQNRFERDEACAVLWRLLAAGDSPAYARLLPYYEQIAQSSQHDACIIKEFILYQNIIAGKPITPDEISHMLKLYEAQGVVTARTKTVAAALGGDFGMFEELAAFEWVRAEQGWTDVRVSEAAYVESLDGGTPPQQEGVGGTTYVFRVGYVNVYTLEYTADGLRHKRVVRRDFSPGARELIMRRAREQIAERTDARRRDAGFLLLAGRLCVDSNWFMEDIIFEYIALMSEHAELRDEAARAALFVLNNKNALAKACLYTREPEQLAERLKGFFCICFSLWHELKKHTQIGEVFAFIMSLERIAGAGKLNGLSGYLHEQILYNPHIRADLSEEYRQKYRLR